MFVYTKEYNKQTKYHEQPNSLKKLLKLSLDFWYNFILFQFKIKIIKYSPLVKRNYFFMTFKLKVAMT